MKFKNIKYLLFFVITFSLAVQAHRMLLKPAATKINTKEIEETLIRMENEAEDILLHTAELIKNDRFEYLSADSVMLPIQGSELPQSNHSLIIYKNNKLKYWSDNEVQVPHEYDDDLFKPFKIVKISNAWYEPIIKKYENFKIIVLIKIKNNFSYKNKYLKNSYNEAFNIPTTTDISSKPARGAVNINGKSGDIVFSLNYSKTVHSVAEYKGFVSMLYFISIAFLLLFFNYLFGVLSKKNYHSFIYSFFRQVLLL